MDAPRNSDGNPAQLQRAIRKARPTNEDSRGRHLEPKAASETPGAPAPTRAVAATTPTPAELALARRGLEGLVEHFRDADRRFPIFQHLLIKREPGTVEWKAQVPIDEDGFILHTGSHQPSLRWNEPGTHWYGQLFGETPGYTPVSRFSQLVRQAVIWQQKLGRAPSGFTSPVTSWLMGLYDLAWSGHPVIEAPTKIRRHDMSLHCVPTLPCWFAFLSPGVFEASALATEVFLEGLATQRSQNGAIGNSASAGSLMPESGLEHADCGPLEAVDLRILWALAKSPVLMTNEDLALPADVCSKTVGRRVIKLIELGLVQRFRGRRVHLTVKGKAFLARLNDVNLST